MNSSPEAAPSSSTGDPVETLMLTLYIAGNALNSLRALTNLKAICEVHFQRHCQIEIVDIYDEPLRALEDKVLVTPTLVKTAPAPNVRIVGDLRDTETVVLALQSMIRKS